MYTVKEKVKERLSRLFAHSPDSSSSQARPYSKEGKSVSSYFSYIIPSVTFDRSKLNKHQYDLEPFQPVSSRYSNENYERQDDSLHRYVDCRPVCVNKDTLNNKIDDEDQASGRSTSSSEVFEEASDQHAPRKPLPNLTNDSRFISAELFEFLESSLPNIVKGCQWVLLYSTLKHGISLRTLIRKSSELSGPCLLIVGDMQGAVFGGLLECPLKLTAKRKYQGSNQTFVFTTIYGEPRLFRPTGANRYYFLCLNELLALGGGGNFALCLDGDLLTGTSGPCETFGNLCLAHSSEFELKNVELWGFTHASHYLG
ncbi:oxidation resistance protein 1-like [Quillaja saponaria]|uniref:Oxidation resistance protein 1-like n=1 Tax=Quillaja saponaria TaxID=32244 RepID=A0AAD7LC96_QUISA|nr:oxidation resistance protein 1-like [Quillaja saponaria]